MRTLPSHELPANCSSYDTIKKCRRHLLVFITSARKASSYCTSDCTKAVYRDKHDDGPSIVDSYKPFRMGVVNDFFIDKASYITEGVQSKQKHSQMLSSYDSMLGLQPSMEIMPTEVKEAKKHVRICVWR